MQNLRAEIVHDVLGYDPRALEPDGHGKSDDDMHRELRERRGIFIDVAAVDVVADLQREEQRREENGERVREARREIVLVLAQEPARSPERKRRYAVTPQEPVEDRRSAEIAARDARLISNARNHQRASRGS